MPVEQIHSTTDRAVLTCTFANITPQTLFPYFTEIEKLSQWWSDSGEIDLKVGGAYRLRWEQMDWTLQGVYKVIEPAKMLAFSWNWLHEPDLPERDVTFVFSSSVDDTTVIVTHGFYTESPRDQEDRESHIQGWLHFLAQLDKVIRTN